MREPPGVPEAETTGSADNGPEVLLLVDDEESVLKSLERLLNRDGYKVLTARDGEAALERLGQEPADLVLADYMLPGMNGVELLTRVKERDATIIRLLLTGRQEMDVIKTAVNKAGIYHFIGKPWEDEELLLTVRRALEYRQSRAGQERLKIENAVIRELSMFKGMGSILYESDGVRSLLADVLEQLLRLTHSGAGVALLVDPGNGRLKTCCAVGETIAETGGFEKALKWMEMTGRTLMISGGAMRPELPFEVDLDKSRPTILTPLLNNGQSVGMVSLLRSSGAHEFSKIEIGLVEALAGPLTISVQNSRLNESIKSNFYATVKALAMAIEVKDPYTRGHSERVMSYAISIAESMDLSPEEKSDLRFAALLHDIGKIGVPDRILNKTGKLTEVEYAEIKKHPTLSGKIINDIPALRKIVPIVESHHERFDGRGYPAGLAGREIPLFARVLAVADVYEALTSDRTYRRAMPEAEALEIIKSGHNTQFDGEIVELFLKRFSNN